MGNFNAKKFKKEWIKAQRILRLADQARDRIYALGCSMGRSLADEFSVVPAGSLVRYLGPKNFHTWRDTDTGISAAGLLFCVSNCYPCATWMDDIKYIHQWDEVWDDGMPDGEIYVCYTLEVPTAKGKLSQNSRTTSVIALEQEIELAALNPSQLKQEVAKVHHALRLTEQRP